MSVNSINLVSKRLTETAHLTSEDIAALQQRLHIAFKDRDMKRRKAIPGNALEVSELNSRSRLKKAHTKYREVFHKHPHLFLQFILAVGIRACSSCNIENILNSLKRSYPTIALASSERQRIEEVARKQEIDDHSLFLEWMNVLFGKPIISKARQTFIAGDIQALHSELHDQLYRRIMNSPKRIDEVRTGGVTIKTTTTYCAETVVPEVPYDDMVLWLDIALDKTFLRELFPDYENQLSGKDESAAEILLSPCSTSCLGSIFKPLNRERWQKSHLRTWEEKLKLTDMTAGIQLRVRCNDLSSGRLRLCFSYEWYQEMATLYSCPAELEASEVNAVS